MIKFGKHKGKTYNYMIDNEKSYCIYVLNQNDCSGDFKIFQNFLNNNIKKLYNINELKNISSINCSELTNYMFYDKNVSDIINKIKINSNDVEKITRNSDINSSLFGQFIDYLIRYEISKILDIDFKDRRTESILKCNMTNEYIELQNIVCESLFVNLNDIETFDEEFINELVDNSDKDINEIQKIVNNYINKIEAYDFIRNSYFKLQNINCNLIDILNVSISHSLFFGNNDDIIFKNYNKEIINKKSHENL